MSDLDKRQKNEIVRFDPDAFKLKFSPKNMKREFRDVNSIKNAVELESESLSVYRKQSNHEFIEGMIELQLHDLNNSINVHEKLSDEQIEDIAIEINTLYWHLSMVELHLVLKKAKRGEYGRINYSLNMPDVLGWFEKYAEERVQYFMKKSSSQGIEHKQNNEQSKVIDEAALKVLKAFKATLDKNEKFNQEDFQKFKAEYSSIDHRKE